MDGFGAWDASCISISAHCFPLTQGLCVCCGVLLFFLRVRWLFLSSLLISLISVPPLLLCLEFSDLDFVFLFKWEGIGADGCHLLCFCQLLSFVFSLELSFGSEDL